jgi:predicted transcriptional regulator
MRHICMTRVILKYFSNADKQSVRLLILPCELAVKSVIPAVKALMATELVQKHGLRQSEAAEILGMSQSAVSRYTRRTRGHIIRIGELKEMQPMISRMTDLVLGHKHQREELMTFFCQVCATVRKSGLVCPFCRRADPKIEIEHCSFCLT